MSKLMHFLWKKILLRGQRRESEQRRPPQRDIHGCCVGPGGLCGAPTHETVYPCAYEGDVGQFSPPSS